MTDWPVKTLGDICEVFDDGDWIESKDQAPSGVRLIQTGNVGDGEFKDRSDKARFISESTFSRLRCTEIYPGDLLVSRLPDPVGRACLIPETGLKMITAVDCTIMRPLKDIMLPQFLVSSTQTSSYREQVRAKITGTTRDRISRSNLAEVQVSVPPLEEQKRIVALLDAATARVTELTACYEQARTHANDLFSSALRNALESNPDWPVKTLGDISEISYGYTESAKSEAVGPKFLRITDIKDRGVNWDDVPYCPIDEVQLNRHRLKDGDIVFARTGATTGKSFLVTSPPLAVCASYLIRLRIDKKLILPDFLNLNFQTNGYWKQVNEGMSGAAQGGFNATKLGALEVPVPPLEEQKQIIARLDSIRAKTLEMVAAYDEKLSSAKNLRQSILEAAFAGAL